MGKLPKESLFLKTKYCDLVFGHFEANLLAYIAEFETNNLDCFASRQHIAAALHVSETRVQDAIKRLLKANAITVERNARKRVLRTNPHRHEGIGFHPQRDRNPTFEGSESNQMRDRNPINTKIHITLDPNTQIQLLNDSVKVKYEMVWDSGKQAMIRKRVAC